MFYFNEGWKPYGKKFTYTETVTAYENGTAQFEGKDNLVIEDIVLTSEQLGRLEVIRNTDMTLKDIITYVMTGTAQGQVIELDRLEQSRKDLEKLIYLIPPESMTEDVLAMANRLTVTREVV